ncbi:hypothetical protein TNCT_30021 [Trichonephila clavata]|uniref:Uncharacterized protein n=1 Tax=Trichonephila clavata TaxID=2740835 RepID=A0A8X6JV92_TRICU|nr:hypothetical protein TNCT_30021 [Trichonephila clavata]
MCIRYFISKDMLLLLTICLSALIGRITCGAVTTFGRPSAGKNAVASENWGVLSQGTQIFLLILGGILALFSLYGLFRLYKWCHLTPRKNGH